MRTRHRFILLAIAWVVGDAPLAAEEPKAIVAQIVSSWRAQQAKVQTLFCRTQVDSFYPKGIISAELRFEHQGKKQIPDYPVEDVWFKNETASWTFDFVGKRVRKELEFTTPYLNIDRCELRPTCKVHIFADQKYRLFQPVIATPG